MQTRTLPEVSPGRRTLLVMALAGTALAACTTTGSGDKSPEAQRKEIDAGVDGALARLYEQHPDAKQLVSRAAGVLVFPRVISASFGIGGEHGDGALRVGGRTVGYYSTTAGSIGFQAGAQSKAIILLFMTAEALKKFRDTDGWTAGADATVAVADIGATGKIDTQTAQQPVIGFVMTNAGLAAGVSLQGAKVSRLAI